jgi:hypothetical protein
LWGKNQVYCLTIYKNAVNSTYAIVYAIVVDYFLDNQTVLFYAIVVDYSLDNQSFSRYKCTLNIDVIVNLCYEYLINWCSELFL